MCLAQSQAPERSAPPSSGAPSRWQDQYAKPGWQDELTKLTPAEESKFQDWAKANKAPITPDYDMRGFWKDGAKGSGVDKVDGQLHYPDTYKLPGHESFSGESKFSRRDIPTPQWNDKDQLVDSSGKVLYDAVAAEAERKKRRSR